MTCLSCGYGYRPTLVEREETGDSLSLVADFHRTFSQPIADAPNIADAKLNELRVRLIAEELCELAEALGFKLDVTFVAEGLPTDEVETLDALVDLQYVLDGAFLSLGYHRMKSEGLAEVHRSNLSKLDERGRPVVRADGKIIKSSLYSPPDLGAVVSKFKGEP